MISTPLWRGVCRISNRGRSFRFPFFSDTLHFHLQFLLIHYKNSLCLSIYRAFWNSYLNIHLIVTWSVFFSCPPSSPLSLWICRLHVRKPFSSTRFPDPAFGQYLHHRILDEGSKPRGLTTIPVIVYTSHKTSIGTARPAWQDSIYVFCIPQFSWPLCSHISLCWSTESLVSHDALGTSAWCERAYDTQLSIQITMSLRFLSLRELRQDQ